MKRFFVSLILIATVFTGLSCGCSLPKAAEETAATFYETIEQHDYEETVELCSEGFFEINSEDDMLEMLSATNRKLGDLVNFELVGWKIYKQAGVSTIKNGTYYTLQYEVEYTEYDAQETLTLFKPHIGGELQVYGYHINSKGFME